MIILHPFRSKINAKSYKNTFKQLAQKSSKKPIQNHPETTTEGSPNDPRELHNEPRVPATDWQNSFWRPPGFKNDPPGAQSDPRGAQSDPPGPPQALKTSPLDIQNHSWNLFGPHFRTFVRALCLQFRFLLPPRPFDPPTKQLLETRAGGMRGAIS